MIIIQYNIHKTVKKNANITSVLVKSFGELVDGGGNLQTLTKDSLLTLETNVFGPFDETGNITFRLDILAY